MYIYLYVFHFVIMFCSGFFGGQGGSACLIDCKLSESRSLSAQSIPPFPYCTLCNSRSGIKWHALKLKTLEETQGLESSLWLYPGSSLLFRPASLSMPTFCAAYSKNATQISRDFFTHSLTVTLSVQFASASLLASPPGTLAVFFYLSHFLSQHWGLTRFSNLYC